MEDQKRGVGAWGEEGGGEGSSPLARARLHLASVYAANSLFWIFLACRGHRPKDNEALMKELVSSSLPLPPLLPTFPPWVQERIKEYMGRLKTLEDRALAPKLNPGAAKAFVRSALFDVDAQNEVPTNSTSTLPRPSLYCRLSGRRKAWTRQAKRIPLRRSEDERNEHLGIIRC